MSSRSERRRAQREGTTPPAPASGLEIAKQVEIEAEIKASATSSALELREIFRAKEEKIDQILADGLVVDGKSKGYESLSTNRRGHRDAAWFERTGKYFSLGHATECIVVGVFDPKIGLAASHRNTRTPDDDTDKALRERLGRLRLTEIEERMKQARGTRIAREAVAEALEEFATMSGGQIPPVLEVYTYGVAEYPASYKPLYEAAIQDAIVTSPLLQRANVHVNIQTRIGMRGTINYGGLKHPKYKIPTFVPSPLGQR